MAGKRKATKVEVAVSYDFAKEHALNNSHLDPYFASYSFLKSLPFFLTTNQIDGISNKVAARVHHVKKTTDPASGVQPLP